MVQVKNQDNLQMPQSVLRHPGLTTDAERELLFRVARNHFQGTGLVIDAGTFLGASTAALSEGLRASGNLRDGTRPIRSYDIAVWYDSMNRYLERPAFAEAFSGRRPKQGESFEPEIRKLLRPYEDLVELVIGDIIKTAKIDQPVEIAFFDCLKTNDRDLASFRAFAPHYVPGHTVVLQQDYFYESASYNKIRQEYFSDRFEFLGRTSTTAAFRLLKPIDPDEISGDPVSELPLERQVALIRQAAARANDARARTFTELAVVEHLIDEGAADWARTELADQEKRIRLLGTGVLTRRPEEIAGKLKARLENSG